MDINKSPGPCDPYMKILKIFANNFAIPLTDIFNESFQTQITFPSNWEKYRIIGVPKITPGNSVEDLRPIALTSVLGKLQESFAVKWFYEVINGKISNSQYGGLPKSSAVLALVRLLHNWHKAMDETQRVIRIVFLDFRKAFDLIDHNKLLKNMCNIGVRPTLIKWFAVFLKDRSHFTKFGKEESGFQHINGGVPQGSKVAPVAFVIHINKLPEAIKEVLNLQLPRERQNDDYVIIDDDTILFMDDSTTYEVIDVHSHIPGTKIGYTQEKFDAVKSYAENEKMQLNLKKCKEMLIDLRRQKTAIPHIKVEDITLERVTRFKLLELWVDDNLKWNTKINHTVKKAAKRLHLLKVLKSYGAPKKDLNGVLYICN